MEAEEIKVCQRCGKELTMDEIDCCISCVIELVNVEANEKGFGWRLVKVPGGVKKVPLD